MILDQHRVYTEQCRSKQSLYRANLALHRVYTRQFWHYTESTGIDFGSKYRIWTDSKLVLQWTRLYNLIRTCKLAYWESLCLKNSRWEVWSQLQVDCCKMWIFEDDNWSDGVISLDISYWGWWFYGKGRKKEEWNSWKIDPFVTDYHHSFTIYSILNLNKLFVGSV